MSADNRESDAINTFLFGVPVGFFDQFTQIEGVKDPFREPLLAFKSNLASAFQVGNVPFQLTHAAVLGQRFNQLMLAEKIRCRTKVEQGEIAEHETERVAYQIARTQLNEELADREMVNHFADSVLQRLSDHIGNTAFREVAYELLRQVLVMCWGAFEILVNDTMRALLNARPHLIDRYRNDREYKALFTGGLLLDALEGNGFNISEVMGDIFCEVIKLDSLERIRAVLTVCPAESSLDVMLKDERLWRLSQQRHLIVHRRGVIDARYLERTSERGHIGEHFKIESKYVEESLALVRDIGCNLSAACRSLLAEDKDI